MAEDATTTTAAGTHARRPRGGGGGRGDGGRPRPRPRRARDGDAAALVVALRRLADAGSRSDVLAAERRLRSLLRPGAFSPAVTERAIKAAAMAGLTSLASDLLRPLLARRGTTEDADAAVPSAAAYVAVLGALRRRGRVGTLERTLADLAAAARRDAARRRRGGGGGGGGGAGTGAAGTGIDLVAFNIYLGGESVASRDVVAFARARAPFPGGRPGRIGKGKGAGAERLLLPGERKFHAEGSVSAPAKGKETLPVAALSEIVPKYAHCTLSWETPSSLCHSHGDSSIATTVAPGSLSRFGLWPLALSIGWSLVTCRFGMECESLLFQQPTTRD